MKLPITWNRPWQRRMLLVASVVVFVVLASHPELRLFLPFIDAVGLDLFVVLLCSQLWGCLSPAARAAYASATLPLARAAYRALIFFLGCIGPYVHARLCNRFPPLTAAA